MCVNHMLKKDLENVAITIAITFASLVSGTQA